MFVPRKCQAKLSEKTCCNLQAGYRVAKKNSHDRPKYVCKGHAGFMADRGPFVIVGTLPSFDLM